MDIGWGSIMRTKVGLSLLYMRIPPFPRPMIMVTALTNSSIRPETNRSLAANEILRCGSVEIMGLPLAACAPMIGIGEHLR